MKNLRICIKKSPIKVLWIDTSRIWGLDLEVWEKIAKLVVERKIVVVDTGQLTEMVERYSNGSIPMNEVSKKKIEIYKTITNGYMAIDHVSFISRQIETAMFSFVKGEDEMKFEFSDLFDDLIQSLTPMYDELNKVTPRKVGTSRAFKTLSSDIVGDWETIHQEARAKKQSLKVRRDKELLGMHDALLEAMNGTNKIRRQNLVDHYLRKWKRASENIDFMQMLGFFRSKHYNAIPYVDIHSWIISDLIIGEEKPKSSDYFDVIMISMILPFADFMLVDNSMRNRIVNKLKLVKPVGDYDCKLITLSELEKTLDSM